jgi:hypothetical protein
MQITNKNICKIHNTYAVLYTQGPLASVGNVSPDEGIASTSSGVDDREDIIRGIIGGDRSLGLIVNAK